MYKIYPFEEKDPDKILSFMQAHSFVTLIGFDGEYPVATQVPIQIYQDQDSLRLIGHVMKNTDHAKAFGVNENVLALFTGAHAYVSASVYEKPASASTWNYKSVQAKGKIRLLDAEETLAAIRNLTNHYEDPATSSAAFHKMDKTYIDKNLKAIVGFEIKVTELDAVFKLSQNHSEKNRKAIIAQLAQRADGNAIEVAKQMEEGL